MKRSGDFISNCVMFLQPQVLVSTARLNICWPKSVGDLTSTLDFEYLIFFQIIMILLTR